MCSQNDDPTQHDTPRLIVELAPALRDYLQRQMEFIRQEAEATRRGPNAMYSMRDAMHILVFQDRVERNILTPAEATVVFA